MKTSQQGFTLIEILIVVAIVGILVAIAYPSYDEHVKRGNRTEGQTFLSDVAARQERYFSQNNEYITADADIAKLGLSSPAQSATNRYTLAVAKVADDGGYTLTVDNQFNDAKCLTLTLDALGVKGSTGSRTDNNDCWR